MAILLYYCFTTIQARPNPNYISGVGNWNWFRWVHSDPWTWWVSDLILPNLDFFRYLKRYAEKVLAQPNKNILITSWCLHVNFCLTS